ncbi:hypothetical protein Poli38472_002865 [Pythium oligandrum]|uniref:Orn/DAP/Arg decarboxylase 2 N-terminal domain-containing protein n=1 Tax=Pythium oligandrum TaxID=41045 RepID=A0A8K1FB64_PYTOL|nr:hypothetical protein Poli38472_002865 [Pythium oligandrum]|eukprot:TMW56940.1 hypothetical protein Poli38472_002865 [Pythium oligandrum]
MERVEWTKYVALYDGANAPRVVQQLCDENALELATVGTVATTVLHVLHQQQKAQAYVAPASVQHSDAEERDAHEKRSRQASGVVSAVIAHGLLHDENPLVNLFDVDAYRARLENLHAAFPEKEFNHAVAIKSNPVRGILREAQRLGCGAECASYAEAKHSLSLGFAPRSVVYDSPCKTRGELKEMLLAGVFINLDNEQEIGKLQSIFAEIGEGHDYEAQIGMRINPVVGGGSIDATSTATVTSKFGLPWTDETSERLFGLYEANPWLQGVHVHVGSQGCPIDLLVAGAKRAVLFAVELNRRVGRQQIKVVDIGGGLPTVYDGGIEEAYDFKVYADAIRAQVPELFTSGFSTIITEFGRAIFVKPGITVSKVEAVKNWSGQNIAVIHAGADHFPRTAYLPHLWTHSVSVLDSQGRVKPASVPYVRQDIAGPLCFSGDFMAKQVLLPQIEVGDLVVIHDTGGYTFSTFSKYNSRQAASYYAHTGVDGASFKFSVLKERETAEETLAFWGLDRAIEF